MPVKGKFTIHEWTQGVTRLEWSMPDFVQGIPDRMVWACRFQAGGFSNVNMDTGWIVNVPPYLPEYPPVNEGGGWYSFNAAVAAGPNILEVINLQSVTTELITVYQHTEGGPLWTVSQVMDVSHIDLAGVEKVLATNVKAYTYPTGGKGILPWILGGGVVLAAVFAFARKKR